jgi:hypothetical protein
MRVLFGLVLFPVLASSACGIISGVSGYEELTASGDAAVSQLTKETGLVGDPDAVGAHKDTSTPLASDASGDATVLDEDTGIAEEAASPDSSEPTDAMDTGSPDDTGSLPDVAPDAPPPACGPMTCSHCCSAGECVGGGSVTTCGTGGAECKDCTNMGGACGSNGSCTTSVKDAAPPPTCSANKCGGCVASFQRGCCKSDETCGCQWIYVPGSGCQ